MEIQTINNTDTSPDTLKEAFEKANANFTELKKLLYYGVRWDVTNSSPDCTRIGNLSWHVSLPLQSQMKTALLNDDGSVNYYLKEDNWDLQDDGVTASNLDGTDGQVMTWIPDGYWQFVTAGNIREVRCSAEQFYGATFIEGQWISSFEASLNRTNNKLSSVVNTSSDYRGGDNTSAWDSEVNTLLGRPVTDESRTSFRTYARNRGAGWQMYNYNGHKFLWWNFVVEYATRNSQKAVNGALTAEGYRQGGLGSGVTTASSSEWSDFSSYNPFIPCGASNSFGNFSGEVSLEITDFGGAGVNRTFTVNRYRGVELPFGHIWKSTDPINIKIQADGDGGESQVWISDDPADWNDSDYVGYTNRGLLPRANGYMNQALFGDGGEFVPKVASGGSTTYFCDYFYTSIPDTGESLRTLRLGGSAYFGSYAGFVCSNSSTSPSAATADIGSRLVYIPT